MQKPAGDQSNDDEIDSTDAKEAGDAAIAEVHHWKSLVFVVSLNGGTGTLTMSTSFLPHLLISGRKCVFTQELRIRTKQLARECYVIMPAT